VERQIVKRGRQIDALNATIFTLLSDDAARRRFIVGHNAWLAYRHAYCLSRSDSAEGGTLASLIDATCTAQISVQHIADLRDFVTDLGGKRGDRNARPPSSCLSSGSQSGLSRPRGGCPTSLTGVSADWP
jgi:hypothetical protein